MHEPKDHGPGPNRDWDWEEVVDGMFDAIAHGFATIDFDEEVFGPSAAAEVDHPAAAERTVAADLMPPELDIPDQP